MALRTAAMGTAAGDPAGPEDPDEHDDAGPTPWLSARSVLARFWPYARPERPRLLAAAVLLVGAAACDTAVVAMFTAIVDDALTTGTVSRIAGPAAIWVGLTLAGALCTVAGGSLLVAAGERVVARLREATFAHLQRLGPDFHARHAAGDLVARVVNDVEEIEALVSSGLVTTVVAAGTAVFFTVAAATVRWQLALVVAALMPLLWLLTRVANRQTKSAARTERHAAGRVGALVARSLANLTVVQAYGTEDVEARKLAVESRRWRGARVRAGIIATAYAPVSGLIESAGLLAVLCLGAVLIAGGQLTVGGLVGFAAYLGYLYPPLTQLGELNLIVTSAIASSERLVEVLDARPRVVERPGASAVPARAGALELREVGYSHDGVRRAVDGVDLRVRAGELVLVTGPSGAGKSTLTSLLLRFADPDAGAVLLDGVDLRDRTLDAVRRSVTLLPQEAMLFDATVAENIAYGTPGASPRAIGDAARAAGADAFVRALPQGYDTLLGEGGTTLSGGQRQRLAIARALLRPGPVLVLDEPTSGLDGPTAAAILGPLRRLAAGRTTVLVSHDLRMAPFVDRIVVLDGGRVVATGRHEELHATSAVYHRLWAVQHPVVRAAPAVLPGRHAVQAHPVHRPLRRSTGPRHALGG